FCIYYKPRFPLDKSDLLKKWLDNIGITNWTPNDSSLLCSEHFEHTCFHKSKGKYVRLKDGSVPTIFKVEDCNIIKTVFFLFFTAENNRLSMFDTGIINSVNHDHYYDASSSTLRKKLIRSQEALKNKERKIKLQNRQLQRLRTRITSLKEVITNLRSQRMVSENCLSCLDSISDQGVKLLRKLV
ncbi:THAP domain-containing protein, partial [Ooceraea biroi]